MKTIFILVLMIAPTWISAATKCETSAPDLPAGADPRSAFRAP